MTQSAALITPDRIEEIDRAIRPYIRRTPLLRTDASEFGLAPGPLWLKLELLQHSGSFKARGAFANLLCRTAPKAGVAAASGGNHGAAVAYAAHRLGIPATIFVPGISSPAKMERIRSCGATLVVEGERYADALAASERFVEATGALAVHAYDQVETLLGQGTVGFEIESDAVNIDTLLVAVGGGGLIGGTAAWYAGRAKVVAVEPDGAPTLHAAFEAGGPVDAPAGGIAADSLAPKRVGDLPLCDRPALRGAGCRPGQRCGDQARAGHVVGSGTSRRRAGWRGGPRGADLRPLPTGGGRACCRGRLWRKHERRRLLAVAAPGMR
jgi:threonine dehydratase